jgi:hypothetical protein
MKIPMMAGRGFTLRDSAESQKVVVNNFFYILNKLFTSI